MHIDRERLRKLNEERESREDKEAPAGSYVPKNKADEDSLIEIVAGFKKKDETASAARPKAGPSPEQHQTEPEDAGLIKMVPNRGPAVSAPAAPSGQEPKKFSADSGLFNEIYEELTKTEPAQSSDAELPPMEEIRFPIPASSSEKKEPEKKEKKKIPGKWILLGAVLLVLLLLVFYKVYMDVSYQPAEQINLADYQDLNISITDNEIEVRNPNLSNAGSKTGIIFYSDRRVEGECYLPLMIALAHYGYDCFLPKAFGNQPFLNAEGAVKITRKYPNIKRWVLVGHSASCNAAASYVRSNPDAIGGLVYLGGYSNVDLSALSIPLLSVTGTNDTVVDPEKQMRAKANDPLHSEYYIIDGANNSGFLNSALLAGDSEASISSETQIGITAEAINLFTAISVPMK